MSSRIYLRGETGPAGAAEPFAWRRVGGEFSGGRGAGGPEEEIERLTRQARETGRQEGFAAGRAEAAREIEALTGRVAQTVAELAEWRPRLRRQAEADLVQLALAIARRILHRELSVDPEAMRGLIQAALEKLQSQEICRVRIHPSAEPVVRPMLAASAQARAVEILADPALERGAAVFETARGDLDASVGTQLAEIEQGLADRLRRQG